MTKLPDVSRLTFDSKKHAYTLDGTKLLSGVTTVIDGTSSKANLLPWAARMVCESIRENCQRNDLMAYLVHEADLEIAEKAHTRKKEKAGTKGTDTHALVEEYILSCIAGGDTVSFHPDILPFVTWATQNNVRFISAEQRLYNEEHALAGTADFICEINGELVMGDLKTYAKMWDISAFHQLGAYSLMWKSLTGETPKKSVVVRMCDPADERLKKYRTDAFAVYWREAIEEDMEGFLCRLKLYRQMQNFTSPKN